MKSDTTTRSDRPVISWGSGCAASAVIREEASATMVPSMKSPTTARHRAASTKVRRSAGRWSSMEATAISQRPRGSAL